MAEEHKKTTTLQDSISAHIPAYVIRFEDLLTDPTPILKDLFRFLLEVPSIEGTVVEQRINETCTPKNAPKSLYKLKNPGS